jgi:glutamate-1-semialdehyde 2,1-aminomutase
MSVETTPAGTAALDRERIKELTEREKATLAERTKRSREYLERGMKVMPGGVPSSFQQIEPWPVYVRDGKGSRVWDVDGNDYTDFHNGFGVMCVGHANPKVVEAVQAQVEKGTHFAAPTEHSILVAEELQRRFRLPQWRFNNSGSEATLDAVHLARASTGRDVILKIEGAYHGHHDHLMVSVYPDLDQVGDRENPNSVPFGAGFPRAITELTRVVPYNDADALERTLDRLEGQVAGLIMEPAMMNIKIVMPQEGYLERVRELTSEHGVKLIFDEVKTGSTIAPGGASERFGIEPDMITLAKATFGGFPGGAIGMTEEIAELIQSGEVHQYGTFNGNPLVMAAAHAALTEILTRDAFKGLEATNDKLLAGSRELLDRYGLPGYPVGLGAKGCVVFADGPIREYRDYLAKINGELDALAWLYHMNRGVFMTPGVEEEWTLSVAHTDDDVGHYLAASEEFARDLTSS